ncbi:hypothetical protein SISSUDRAFT_1068074 [Sistotremastrum suecicum HHB10207 ss-3]|uniref:HMG box domain-containing protein n=1 Tax=Sistotremastrum suecicum HHB10207 ss-3 TaxID=1314776 RepID=A0A165WG99_9AGAM|nr:hypothetical protein SISSUDRAFT_1068074 [Sistotremastrum suecicum HHB10207 ss-3]
MSPKKTNLIRTQDKRTRAQTRKTSAKSTIVAPHSSPLSPTLTKSPLRKLIRQDFPDVSVVPKKFIEELFALADRCPPNDYAELLSVIKTGHRSHSAIRTPGHVPRTPNCYIIFRVALWSFRAQIAESLPSTHRLGQGNYFSCLASSFWRQLKSSGGVLHGRNVVTLCRNIAAFAAAEHQRLHPDYKYRPRRNTMNKPPIAAQPCYYCMKRRARKVAGQIGYRVGYGDGIKLEALDRLKWAGYFAESVELKFIRSSRECVVSTL